MKNSNASAETLKTSNRFDFTENAKTLKEELLEAIDELNSKIDNICITVGKNNQFTDSIIKWNICLNAKDGKMTDGEVFLSVDDDKYSFLISPENFKNELDEEVDYWFNTTYAVKIAKEVINEKPFIKSIDIDDIDEEIIKEAIIEGVEDYHSQIECGDYMIEFWDDGVKICGDGTIQATCSYQMSEMSDEKGVKVIKDWIKENINILLEDKKYDN